MNTMQTPNTYTISGPTVSNVPFRIYTQRFSLPTKVRLLNTSAPVIGKFRNALLEVINLSPTAFDYMGSPGTGGSGNLANPTVTPKYMNTGNYPFGNTGVPVKGMYQTAVGATLVPTDNNLGASDVMLTNMLATTNNTLAPTTNIVTISASANAIITLTDVFYKSPYTNASVQLTAGMVIHVGGASSSTTAEVNSYNGNYTITAVDAVTKQVTTSRNTTGFGTFVNLGSARALTILDASGRVLPQGTNMIGSETGTPANASFIQIAANSAILVAMANTTAFNIQVDIEYIY